MDPDAKTVAMLVYAFADVVGARFHGEKSNPEEVAERATAFAGHLERLAEKEKPVLS